MDFKNKVALGAVIISLLILTVPPVIHIYNTTFGPEKSEEISNTDYVEAHSYLLDPFGEEVKDMTIEEAFEYRKNTYERFNIEPAPLRLLKVNTITDHHYQLQEGRIGGRWVDVGFEYKEISEVTNRIVWQVEYRLKKLDAVTEVIMTSE